MIKMLPESKRSPKGAAAKSRFFRFAAPALLAVTAITLGSAATKTKEQLRAEPVDWARLITPNKDWDIHGDRDPDLAQFIRDHTSLDIHRSPQSANPADLANLCRHPFIYAKDLRWVSDASQLANLGEYLRRGGFLCVDACATEAVNPDMQVYLHANSDIFKRIFPEADIRKLPPTHGIYHSYFNLSRADIYTADMGNQERCADYGLYGVFVDHRMVAVISMYGLECGWPQTPLRTSGCMKFILNIYVYAMTAGPEQ
jgi:hypothetical protein